ncbi:MAG: hypothetical protein PVI90_13925 [Desulfobacteraceae bacterium]|jgi:hypothetical protein
MAIETSLNSDEKAFLLQLYQQTNGDQSRTADTTAIGTAIGMDKINSRKVSEELIGQGYVSVKTLSGSIGITTDGLTQAQRLGAGATKTQAILGKKTIIDANGCKAVEKVLLGLKQALDQPHLTYNAMAELVIDVKTIEVQLLSPKPKTAIIKACLASILKILENAKATAAIHLIHGLIDTSD